MRPILDRAGRGRLRALPDEHLAGLCVLLKACRDVDRIAADHQLPARRGFPARDDVARVDPDPDPDLRAVATLDAVREGAEAVPHRERSPNGALGVVLVRLRNPEDGEHGIAGELLRRAPEALDLRVDQVEELTLKLANVLGIEQLAERSRPGEVGEEHGDDAPLLPLVGRVGSPASVVAQGNPAGRAEGRSRRLLSPTSGASPLKRRAAVATEASTGRVLGTAVGACDCHASSLERDVSDNPRVTTTLKDLAESNRPTARGAAALIEAGFAERTELRDLTPGSVTRTLAETFARELAELHERLEETYESAFLETGTGESLELLVDELCPRRPWWWWLLRRG